MQIFVKTTHCKTITLTVGKVELIDSVMQMIQEKSGTSADLQSLTFGGKQLEADGPSRTTTLWAARRSTKVRDYEEAA